MEEKKKRYVIIGAGPAGLAAAYKLARQGTQVVLIEKSSYPGGTATTYNIKGFLTDFGPHAMHLKETPYNVIPFVKQMIGSDLISVNRHIQMYIKGTKLSHPLRVGEALLGLNPFLSMRIIIDYFWTSFKNKITNPPEDTFKDWGLKRFGPTLYDLFFGNYTEKVWGIPATKLTSKLAKQKVQDINVYKIIKTALGLIPREEKIYFKHMGYVRQGMGHLYKRIADEIKAHGGSIQYNTAITSISTQGNNVVSVTAIQDDKEIKLQCDYLLTTIPLYQLVEYLGVSLKPEVKKSVLKLKYRSLRFVNLILDMEKYSDAQWFYLLDKKFTFNRVSEQKNMTPEAAPKDKTMLSFEICCNYGDQIWSASREEMLELVKNDLKLLKIPEEKITDYYTLSLKDAYPIYDMVFEDHLLAVQKALIKFPNLYPFGRQGLFNNNDMHDSMEMAFILTDELAKNKHFTGEEWLNKVNDYFVNYVGKRLNYV